MSIHGSVGLSRVFLNESIMDENGRKWLGKQCKWSKLVKKSSEMSQMSQVVPKCPLQTHRCPNSFYPTAFQLIQYWLPSKIGETRIQAKHDGWSKPTWKCLPIDSTTATQNSLKMLQVLSSFTVPGSSLFGGDSDLESKATLSWSTTIFKLAILWNSAKIVFINFSKFVHREARNAVTLPWREIHRRLVDISLLRPCRYQSVTSTDGMEI